MQKRNVLLKWKNKEKGKEIGDKQLFPLSLYCKWYENKVPILKKEH